MVVIIFLVDASSPKISFVFIMAPDPEPCYGVPIQYSQRPVSNSYSHRPDIFTMVNAFETQRRMKWVRSP